VPLVLLLLLLLRLVRAVLVAREAVSSILMLIPIPALVVRLRQKGVPQGANKTIFFFFFMLISIPAATTTTTRPRPRPRPFLALFY
jgi:hypothetical protein